MSIVDRLRLRLDGYHRWLFFWLLRHVRDQEHLVARRHGRGSNTRYALSFSFRRPAAGCGDEEERGSNVHRRVAGLHTQSWLSHHSMLQRRRPLQWSRTYGPPVTSVVVGQEAQQAGNDVDGLDGRDKRCGLSWST
jgi:hypothetical protein